MAADPTNRRAPRQRTYHRATKIREDGSVSALCFKSPRAIDMRRATWTIRDEAVTCPKCLEVTRLENDRRKS
jgi:hypothetical protein